MVAACRAIENDQPDSFAQDPFAARLAGDRGFTILQAQPRPEWLQFGMGLRTRFLDELLLDALATNSISTVVSLGCGLDARPWRLDLPPNLRWIDVDFEDMLDYKDSILAGEPTRCRHERMTADLTDPVQRQAIFAAVGSDPALMITEGLLLYLPPATVEDLAVESGVAHWISDIATTAFDAAIDMDRHKSIRSVQPPDFLRGEQILDLLRRHGWHTAARRSYITDIGFALPRIQRLMGEQARRDGPSPELLHDPTGVHRFTRDRSTSGERVHSSRTF